MINNKASIFLNNYLAFILLVLFFITESIGKISIYYFHETSLAQIIVKVLALCLFTISLIFSKDIKLKFLFLTLFACFIIGQLFIPNSFQLNIVSLFFKYLFLLLLLFYFKHNSLTKIARNRLFKGFEYIIIINTVLVFIGFLCSVHFFKSYTGDRFGYNGLFVNSSTGSYIYVISLFYFLNKFRENFLLNPLAIFILLGSILVGTKAVYLSVFFILLFYLLTYTKNKNIVIGVSLVLIGLLIFGYLSFFQFGVFNDIREKDGLLSTLLSFRNYNFINDTLPFIEDNWHVVNYFLGGVNDFSLKSEMGFIDLLFFFGIIGSLAYLITLLKVFLTFKLNKISTLFLFVVISLIFIAGNFFTYSNIAIYLLIIRESFKEHNRI